MPISRRTFLRTGVYSGLAGFLGAMHNNDVSADSTTARHMAGKAVVQRDYNAYRKRMQEEISQRGLYTISYEEWKAGIEKPEGEHGDALKKKAKHIVESPEKVLEYFSNEDIRRYKEFWGYFSLDLSKLPLDKCDKEGKELIMNVAVPLIIEMQADIDMTYGFGAREEKQMDGSIRIAVDRAIDYRNPKEGEKLLIYMHFMHENRYIREGKSRKNVRLF